jgi:hypothetical protein
VVDLSQHGAHQDGRKAVAPEDPGVARDRIYVAGRVVLPDFRVAKPFRYAAIASSRRSIAANSSSAEAVSYAAIRGGVVSMFSDFPWLV